MPLAMLHFSVWNVHTCTSIPVASACVCRLLCFTFLSSFFRFTFPSPVLPFRCRFFAPPPSRDSFFLSVSFFPSFFPPAFHLLVLLLLFHLCLCFCTVLCFMSGNLLA